MTRLALLLAAAALVASPAVAQRQGHDMQGMSMPVPASEPAKSLAAKKPTAKKPTAKKPTVKKPVTGKGTSPAHDRSPAQRTPAQHLDHQTTEPRAGEGLSVHLPDEHAGHDMTGPAVEVPVAPPPAEALQGPKDAADEAWGRVAMEQGRAILFNEHGGMPASKLLIDQFEARVRNGRDGWFLNAEGWYGGDIDKLWVKTEAEGSFGSEPEKTEFQALWSHAIDPWFDLQAGVRLDAQPDSRGRLVLGVQGLAPYWIEVDAAVFLSDKGDITARLEAEHDVRITQKLVVQPRAELDFALQDIPRERIGSGLATAELGLRLRCQLVPNFAPYVGITYERAFGDTARLSRAAEEDVGRWSYVVGLRAWF